MKYLFDENYSVTDKFLKEHPECQNVKYHISKGVKDETILQLTNKEEFVIVTKDIEFALDALIQGFKIIYHDEENNQDSFLQATELPDSFISDFRGLDLQ